VTVAIVPPDRKDVHLQDKVDYNSGVVMSVKIRRGSTENAPKDVQLGTRLTEVPTQYGLPSVEELWKEIHGYVDILLGRTDSPVNSPYLAMGEVATTYYSRAQEIDMLIHVAEREGIVMRGSPFYKFRTGELRSFIELSRKCAELGSRRLTQEQLLHAQRYEE